jgi:hypothetical protein
MDDLIPGPGFLSPAPKKQGIGTLARARRVKLALTFRLAVSSGSIDKLLEAVLLRVLFIARLRAQGSVIGNAGLFSS